MTLEQTKDFDRFFLYLFNQLLTKEEQLIQKKHKTDLTIRELHVIEAADVLSKTAQNTMANISKRLYITPSSLTGSVNQLIHKRYLTKHSPISDKRVSLVELTDEGKRVLRAHQAFHDELVQFIQQDAGPEQTELILSSLEKASQLLMQKIQQAAGE